METTLIGHGTVLCAQLELAPLVARNIRGMTVDVKGGRKYVHSQAPKVECEFSLHLADLLNLNVSVCSNRHGY